MANSDTAAAQASGGPASYPDRFAASLRLGKALLHPRAKTLLGYAGLLLVAYVALFVGMGDLGIVNGNESLYVESAREMAERSDWVLPTLDGLPYLEKPPLFVWLLTVSAHLVSSVEVAPRLVTAFAALLLTFGVARAAARLGIGRSGAVAGFILLTTVGIDVMSRVAMPDMALTALFALGCIGYLVAVREESKGGWRTSAALLGAASLIKGGLAVALFGLIAIAAYAVLPRRRAAMRRLLRDPWALMLMLLPLPLWIIAAEEALPGAAWQVVVNEHILRFLGRREPHDYYGGPVWYYVPRLFLFFFPWAGALLFGWIARARNVPDERVEVRRVLWLCVWIPFAFFSLSSAKANYYILVCLPPMALLTADYLPCLVRERRGFHLSMAVAIPILLFVAIWAWRVWLIRTGATTPLLPTHDGSGPRTIAVLVALSIFVLVLVRLAHRRLAVLCLGFLLVPVSMQFDHLVTRAEPYISAKPLAALIEERFPHARVFLYQDFEAAGALPIYLKRTIPVIDTRSNDLYFGHSIQPHHPSFVTEEQVVATAGETLVVVLNDRMRSFARTDLAGRVEDVAVVGRARVFRVPR